jgi:hypothetical protein
LREDAQAIVFAGYDPGSKGAAGVVNLALTLPHFTLTRLSGDDFWGQHRVGINVLSGLGPVLQYQRLAGAVRPGVSDDPVYLSQLSFGASVNLLDLQVRRLTGIDEKGQAQFKSALIDIQAPVQYFHQYLTDSLGGRPGSPESREADQFGIGINIDYHLTPHLSIFGQAGGQYSSFGGWSLAPVIIGIGLHSEEQ